MVNILKDPESAHWEYSPYDEGVTVKGETHRWVPYEKYEIPKSHLVGIVGLTVMELTPMEQQ